MPQSSSSTSAFVYARDFTVLGQLAWKIYKACKDAPEGFETVSQEVLSLYAALKETEETCSDASLAVSPWSHLRVNRDECRAALDELQRFLDEFKSLDKNAKLIRTRIQWVSQTIPELRYSLIANIRSRSGPKYSYPTEPNHNSFRYVGHESSIASTRSVEFVALGQRAWTIYKACNDLPERFKKISHEVLSLHAGLKEVEESSPAVQPLWSEFEEAGDECRAILDDLQNHLDEHNSLGTDTKRTLWDQTVHVAELRHRLFLNKRRLLELTNSSQHNVHKGLHLPNHVIPRGREVSTAHKGTFSKAKGDGSLGAAITEVNYVTKTAIREKTRPQHSLEASRSLAIEECESLSLGLKSREKDRDPDYFNERLKRACSWDLELQDPMSHIRQEIENKLLPTFPPGLCTATFRVHWNLYKYISEELEKEEKLGNLLTISGTSKKAYCTTCAEYVAMLWPETGLWMLKTIQKIVIDREMIGHNDGATDVKTLILGASCTTSSPFMIRVASSRDILISIAQQLAWLAAISRTPTSEELTCSHVHFKLIDTGNFEITVSGDQPLNKGDESCWHPLFAHTVIAYGFPVPPRSAEMGVEIPFNIMLRLAGTTYVVTHDDGVVLCGFSTLLFPSAYYQSQSETAAQTHSVQWHLVTSANDRSRISAGVELAQHDEDWVKIKDEKLLREARTFLGHCKVSCVHLGTENSGFSEVSESSLVDDKPNPAISVRSGNIGTSGLGIFGATMDVEVVLPRRLARVVKIDYYNDILWTAKNMPMILYDTDKKQAWLVPMLSIILHMVHAWVATHAPDIQLPYAQPDWNGGQAAWDIIAKFSKLELQRSLEDDTPYLLKDLVKRLWEHLISCFDSTILDMRRNRVTIETGRPKLRGWEYMDIIEPSLRSRMKEQVLDRKGCGWDRLTGDVLVLVCKGLGEVIKPAQPESLCPELYPVQRGRNYLTASVACLSYLSQKCGMGTTCAKLADHVFWPPPSSNLFDDCIHGIEGPCHKTLQQLVKKEGHESKTIVPPEGAVLFGLKMNKSWSKSRISGSVSGSSKLDIATTIKDHSNGDCSQSVTQIEPLSSSGQALGNGDLCKVSSLVPTDDRSVELPDQEKDDRKTKISLVESIPQMMDKPIQKSSSRFWRPLYR